MKIKVEYKLYLDYERNILYSWNYHLKVKIKYKREDSFFKTCIIRELFYISSNNEEFWDYCIKGLSDKEKIKRRVKELVEIELKSKSKDKNIKQKKKDAKKKLIEMIKDINKQKNLFEFEYEE